MKINAPCIITPRLLPGLKIGDCFISITYWPCEHVRVDGRTRYEYYIDKVDFVDKVYEYSAHDLKSGCNGGNLQQGLSSLLSLLSAAGEACSFEQRTGQISDNGTLFPEWVNEWAYLNSDELQMLQIELDINHNNDVIVEME